MRHERDKALEEYREMKMALYLKQYPNEPANIIHVQGIIFRRMRHEELEWEEEARAVEAEARAEAAEARADEAEARADRARQREEAAEEDEYDAAYDYYELDPDDDEYYSPRSEEHQAKRARLRKKLRKATDLLFDHKDRLPDRVYLKVCNAFKYAWDHV